MGIGGLGAADIQAPIHQGGIHTDQFTVAGLAEAMARSVLPAAVGPIRQISGAWSVTHQRPRRNNLSRSSRLIWSRWAGRGCTGRRVRSPPCPQQGVHLRDGEAAIGAHRAVTGHGGEISSRWLSMRSELPNSIRSASTSRSSCSTSESRRRPESGESPGLVPGHSTTMPSRWNSARAPPPPAPRAGSPPPPGAPAGLAAIPSLARAFQPFVGDALVGGVHVHQHQPPGILRQNIIPLSCARA